MPLDNLGGKTDCKSSPGKSQEGQKGNHASGAKDFVKEGTNRGLPDIDKADIFYSPPALFTSGLHLQHQK